MSRDSRTFLHFSGSSSFSGPRSPAAASVSHERIAKDLAAFEKAGGHIEKLGNTRVYKPSELKSLAAKATLATEKGR